MNGQITCVWGSGPQTFRLTLAGIEELQEKCGCGPFELFTRLNAGGWFAADAPEIIRLGLIGAGMDPIRAYNEVRRYSFPERPLLESLPAARLILGAALSGVEDDQPGKPEAAEAASASPVAAENGASPTSTASE
jgi:hypothetical protein